MGQDTMVSQRREQQPSMSSSQSHTRVCGCVHMQKHVCAQGHVHVWNRAHTYGQVLRPSPWHTHTHAYVHTQERTHGQKAS